MSCHVSRCDITWDAIWHVISSQSHYITSHHISSHHITSHHISLRWKDLLSSWDCNSIILSFLGVIIDLFRVRSMNSQSAGYPRFRLFTPNPPGLFLGVFADGKKPNGSACIDAGLLRARLLFPIPLVFCQIR